MNISKFIDETQSSQARGGDLGDEDPSVPHQPGGGHTHSDADYVRVQEPGRRQAAGERGTWGVRDSCVPSLRGHAPHAAHRRHASAGEQEDPRGRDAGEVRDPCRAGGGQGQIIMDQEQSSVPSETQTGNDIRRAQYCPSWLQIQYSADSKCSEVMTSFCDPAQAVSDFNRFCWQGPGGLRLAPSLPSDLLTDIKDVMSRLKSPLATPEHPKILKSTR